VTVLKEATKLMERQERIQSQERSDAPPLAELPEVLRVASAMYARDKAQIERATRRLELERAAAEAGLPPEYLERAAAQLCAQRVGEKRQRKRRRLWIVLAGLALLWTGARVAIQPASAPPPEAYFMSAGGPPGYAAPVGPYGGPPDYSSAAAPSGQPGGLGGYPFAPGGPPMGYGPPGYSTGPGGPNVTPPGAAPLRAGANLRGAPLSHANLAGQNLSRANLRGADLTHANLRGVDLKGCDLRGADMTGADLAGAELDGAIYDKFTRWPGGLDPRELGAHPFKGAGAGRIKVQL
jgi:hypothetical protein